MQISHRRELSGQVMKAGCSDGVACSDDVIASSGITFHLWRLYQHAWLVCLFFPLVALVRKHPSTWHLILGLFALLFFAVSYTWLMWPHPASPGARVRAHSQRSFFLFAALSILVLILSLIDGPAWLWLFIGTSAIAGLLLPIQSAFAVIVLFTLLPLFMTVGAHRGIAGVDWWWLIALMLLVRGLGLDMIGIARMGKALRDLHIAQRELARLKVEEERLRLARDLHDLLGQTLSVITLKSELARGLITEDPSRCARELAEIEQVGRMTLREVRKTVAGYRQPTLANELDGAHQLLEAAGIASILEQHTGELPPALDAVLAWIVREGVTNVIRHSHARHCLLRLTREQGMIGAEILNDGAQTADASEKCTGQGNGLPGLRERVSVLGGTLEAGLLTISGKPHFCLHVELPMPRQAQVVPTPEEE